LQLEVNKNIYPLSQLLSEEGFEKSKKHAENVWLVDYVHRFQPHW